MIPPLAKLDILTASYQTFGQFLDILGGKKGPPGGSRGRAKYFFSLKYVFYLDNSNDTSFSSIGHRDGKLKNFLIFLDIF